MVPRHGGPCIAHALANNRKVVSACITEGVRVYIRHHSPCQLVLNLLTGSSACSGPPRGVCCHKTSTVPHSGLPELPLGHATGHGCRRACLGLIPAPTSVCLVGLSSSPSLALCGVISGGFLLTLNGLWLRERMVQAMRHWLRRYPLLVRLGYPTRVVRSRVCTSARSRMFYSVPVCRSKRCHV